MKKHFNNALLYDDNCPLCAAYTSAFIKTGLLDADKRISFSQINMADYAIDYNKARHEIPLVNLQNGNVKYGIDALAEILDQRLFFVKPILRFKPINWFFKHLYRFISYNRKIIVAKPNIVKTGFDCSPDYSFKQRFYLLLFTCYLSNSFLINNLGSALQKQLSSFQPWWLYCWFLVPAFLSVNKSRQQALDIFVHSGIVMLVAAILNAFSLFILQLLSTPNLFVLVVGILPSLVWIQWQIRRRTVFTNNDIKAEV